jgi:glycosyltransferase involved in cell wall biosynthesis
MRRLNVLFATGIYPPDVGGPATYVSHLARELHRRGVMVEVLTYGEAREEDRASPYPVTRVRQSPRVAHRYLSFFRAARIAARRADVLFAQDPLSVGLPTLLASKALRRPLVVKVVGDLAWEIAVDLGRTNDSFTEFQRRRQSVPVELFRRSEHFVARSARSVIAPSQYLREIVQGWGVPEERIAVVHNSLPEAPLETTGRDARRSLGVDGDPLLLAAGRLVPWKRFDLPIRFLSDVKKKCPGARLLLVGSGPLREELESLARELSVRDAVHFVGPLDHPSMMLHLVASDLLLLPSTYEGFSHLLLEAMRAGTPVLATDAGGNAEVVGDAGRLVPAASPEAFGTALVEIAADPGLRAAMAEHGRARAERFSWKNLVEETMKILERAAAPKR